YVLALEVVTGTGELVRLRPGSAKGGPRDDPVGVLVWFAGDVRLSTRSATPSGPAELPPKASPDMPWLAFWLVLRARSASLPKRPYASSRCRLRHEPSSAISAQSSTPARRRGQLPRLESFRRPWSWSTGTAWLRSTNGRTWGSLSRPMWFCLAESMIRASLAMISPIRCWPALRRLARHGRDGRG